jgi:hypothetical protein
MHAEYSAEGATGCLTAAKRRCPRTRERVEGETEQLRCDGTQVGHVQPRPVRRPMSME